MTSAPPAHSPQEGAPSPWDLPRDPVLGRACARLDALAADPPKVILIEGGDVSGRVAAALRLAAKVNCRAADSPCGLCPSCVQIAANSYIDMVFFDGSAGNILVGPRKEADDERPTVRDDVIPYVGRPPHSGPARFFIISEAQSLTENAANALLKSLEEPGPGNHFLLLAAQRERLLPTLVSRSWVLTLPWPDPLSVPSPDAEWIDGLLDFARTGRGWFDRTTKGAVDKVRAARIVLAWQKTVAAGLAGSEEQRPAAWRGLLGDRGLRIMDLVLDQAQDALVYQTGASAVLDWTAVRMWRLIAGREAG